jgi:hypothetical protein
MGIVTAYSAQGIQVLVVLITVFVSYEYAECLMCSVQIVEAVGPGVVKGTVLGIPGETGVSTQHSDLDPLLLWC